MAEAILMPRLSDTMTEGVIAAWHKNVGDPVKKGDLLAEVETDKATMELESYKEGTLLHVGADKGQKLQVNDLLAIIGKPGEDISGLMKSQGSNTAAAPEKKQEKPKEQSGTPEQPVVAEQSKSTAQQPTQQPATDVSKMEEVILMPRLSDTMTEGVIATWHKNVGEAVKKGEVLADIETDKATMELESYKEGKLLYQGAKPGEKIQVNELLAIIGDETKVDVNKIVAAVKGGGSASPAGTGEGQTKSGSAAVQSQPSQTTQATETHEAPASENGRIKASPLAKKLAAEKGIDLKAVQGSGDDGRITKRDIENYKPSAKPTGQPVTQQKAVSQAPQGQVSFEDIPISQMRKVIAKRLAES